MLSDRSGSMLHGAKTARLTLTTTSGTRSRDARCSCSCAYSNPCDDVAVNVRTPARAAAIDVAEHRVLALEIRELDVVASRDEIGEPLDDERLRRDRVAADRADAREHHRVRRGVVGRQHDPSVRQRLAHALTSSIAIAFRTGQTTSQMPQPLQ